MFFSRQLSLANIISLCRAMRHNLGAGLSLVQAFRQQTDRGARGVRPIAGRVLTILEKGDGLGDALENEKGSVPPLLLSLVKVGEETGHLAEIFGELEKYYILQNKLRKDFRSQSMMPLIQLGMAFLILAGLIFILGMIASSQPLSPINGLFGLSGAKGAVIFLILSFGSIGLIWFLISTLGRWMRHKPGLDSFAMHVPIIGPCLEALTLGRFAMALHLTLESGMPIARALRLTLKATGSAAFVAQTETITQAVKNGTTLLEALTRSGLFSTDFLSIVAVGEEGGRIPEVMRHQAEHWNEEASNRLKTATKLAGTLVWLIYAVFMVWAIFSVAKIYFGAIGI